MTRHYSMALIPLAIISMLTGAIARDIKISFIGDIIMHSPVVACAKANNLREKDTKMSLNNKGYDFLFDEVKSVLAGSDIVLGNMEFPIYPPYKRADSRVFNCDPNILPALKNIGINMITIANNHALDQGIKGIMYTLKITAGHGIDTIGAAATDELAHQGIIKNIEDIRVGFIAYTGFTNIPPPRSLKTSPVNMLNNKQTVKNDIDAIRKNCDYLIMIAHTGTEYDPFPKESDRKLMREYIEQGVDLAVMHHPHVIQPLERVTTTDNRTCHIFYSLGNFISNQGDWLIPRWYKHLTSTTESIILELNLSKKTDAPGMNAQFTVVPLYTKNIKNPRAQWKIIQTIPILQEIENLKKIYEVTTDAKKKWVNRQIAVLSQKITRIKKILFYYGESDAVSIKQDLN